MPTKINRIDEFVVPGTQIKSPGGFSFRLRDIVGLEAYEDASNPRLVVHLASSLVTVTFHRNTNGGPPAVYELKRNIEAAINAN